MEFTNEIFFNKKLVQGETVLITYSGKLFKEYSAEITIVYGFGANWEYTSETKMQEKENGFEALITLKNYDTFNFCFKNNYNIWDNNSGFNYISAIEQAPVEETIEEQSIIADSEITEETINTKEENKTENTEIIEEIKEPQENNIDIEKAFSDLLDSILQFEQDNPVEDVNLENGFGLQSVDEEIKETDFTSCDDIFQELYDELIEMPNEDITSSVQTFDTTEDVTKTDEDSNLQNLLNDFNEKQEQKNNTVNSETLNDLMDNILNSIIESDENSSSSSDVQTSELPVVKNNSEEFIDKCIDETFNFFKNVWNGCKKIGQLIKKKAKEFLGEEQ